MAVRRTRRRGMLSEDLHRLRFVSDAQVSPDGALVVYVVSWVDPMDTTRYRSQLVLVPSDGSRAPRPLTSGKFRDSAPRWSPDGSALAFASAERDGDRPQIFLLSLEGGDPRPLTALKHGAGTPVWSPDGAGIAFSARVDIPAIAAQEGQSDDPKKTPRVRVITRVRHKGDGEGLFEALRRHLFVLDVASGSPPRQVTDGDWDDTEPAWSPDGQALAFVSNRERDRDLSSFSDIWIVSTSGGRPRRLTEHRGESSAPTFSPDGQQVAYLGHQRGMTYGAPTELLLVPADGGASRPAVDGFGDEVGNVILSDVRDPGATQRPVWSPDGRSLLAPVSRRGRVEIVRFTPRTRRTETVLGGDREVGMFSVAADSHRLVCTISDPTHPYEVFAVTRAAEQQLSHENDAVLGDIDLVAPDRFAFTSTDGVDVEGWLMRPPASAASGGARQKWPLVLEIHGGPETMYGWTFVHEFQTIAARGYAVLYTNPRGSKGYGEEFDARIFASWGTQDADDCLAAVDAALSRTRWLDPARVGVTGGSYGGFMTAWLIGHTHRFQAAVSQRGCYNMASFYGTSDIGPWFGDYVLGCPPYENEEHYRVRSPLTYAPAMRTPLLLIHSEQDLRCPIEQAEQLFVRLRRIGKTEVEMVRFPEESHNLSRSGRPDRRIERLERIVGWFDTYL